MRALQCPAQPCYRGSPLPPPYWIWMKLFWTRGGPDAAGEPLGPISPSVLHRAGNLSCALTQHNQLGRGEKTAPASPYNTHQLQMEGRRGLWEGAEPFTAPQGQQTLRGCSGPRGCEGCSISPRSGAPISKQLTAARQLLHGNIEATPGPQGARGRMRPAQGQWLRGVPAGTGGLPGEDQPRRRQAPNVRSPREP